MFDDVKAARKEAISFSKGEDIGAYTRYAQRSQHKEFDARVNAGHVTDFR